MLVDDSYPSINKNKLLLEKNGAYEEHEIVYSMHIDLRQPRLFDNLKQWIFSFFKTPVDAKPLPPKPCCTKHGKLICYECDDKFTPPSESLIQATGRLQRLANAAYNSGINLAGGTGGAGITTQTAYINCDSRELPKTHQVSDMVFTSNGIEITYAPKSIWAPPPQSEIAPRAFTVRI